MTKKVKVLYAVVLVLLCFMVLQVSAMYYCHEQPGDCKGSCGCVGDLSSMIEDECCFKCTYYEEEFECCYGIGPMDGCITWIY